MPASDRSEPSRRNLVAAAGDVISDKGLQGLRVREIAARAGLSPGSVIYHYPSNDALLLEVHQGAVERYVETRSAVQAETVDARQRLLNVALAGIPPYADTEVIALLFEMHSLARRSAAHGELMTELWNREVALYADIIDCGIAQGHFRSSRPVPEIAATLLGLEDGLALHLSSRNTALNSVLSLRLLMETAASELGCAELVTLAETATALTAISND
jgi:AcrR family transcriptional regulator